MHSTTVTTAIQMEIGSIWSQILSILNTVSCRLLTKLWVIKDSVNSTNGASIGQIANLCYNLLRLKGTISEQQKKKGMLMLCVLITKCCDRAMDSKSMSTEFVDEMKAKYLKFTKKTKKASAQYMECREDKQYDHTIHSVLYSQFLETVICRCIKQCVIEPQREEMEVDEVSIFDLDSSFQELMEFINENECHFISFEVAIKVFNFAVTFGQNNAEFKESPNDLLCCRYSMDLVRISIDRQTEDIDSLCLAVSAIAARIAFILNVQNQYKESIDQINGALDQIEVMFRSESNSVHNLSNDKL